MSRSKNPLSNRNRNESFTGAELAAYVEKHGVPKKLAASKRARIVRERGEFDVERMLRSIIRAPLDGSPTGGWTIPEIISTRDDQMAGRFRRAARLAESMGTDDAIFTARAVRLAPVQALDVKIVPGKGPRADKIADEAEALFGNKGVAIASDTVTTIRQHLVDHGVAFGCNDLVPRADGSRIDVIHRAWPIEWVWWDPVLGCYVTQVRRLESEPEPTADRLFGATLGIGSGLIEPIIHGNGRWVVYKKSEHLPHRFDATILPGSLVWAAHAYGNRDWRKGSASHGNAKVVGELPADQPLMTADGALTKEAQMFMALVAAVASQDAPHGIRPAGSKIDIMTNTSAAWEVFAKLVENSEKAAARIYLGTDGILGSVGGAPGVDISQLFGVASSKIESDLKCIESGFSSGVVSVWAALNFGDDRAVPSREYIFPDADLARTREDFSKRNAAFLAAVKAAKDAGFTLTPEWIASVAQEYGVPAPTLAATSPGEAASSQAT